MTPNTLAEYLVDSVPIKDGDSILEPALGTGQLLVPILKKYPEMKLTIEGWEKDSQVLEYVEPEVSAHVSVLNVSSLSHAIETDQDKYDVIMSNPPFYEFKPDKETKDNYGDVFSGRANIFSAFFKLSIDLTKPGGHIGFIVPPSMNNGSFFNSLRSYITKHCTLESIRTYPSNLFEEAQTPVQIIVLKKKTSEYDSCDKHVVSQNGITIFVEDRELFETHWNGAVSLSEAGYEVKTGTVVWNKHKEDFVAHRGAEDFPLIYAKDLKTEEEYNPDLYVGRRFLPKSITPKLLESPFIAVNRIVGAENKYLRSKLYNGGYYAENHVNFIVPKENAEVALSMEELTGKINNIDSQYLSLLTGNTQISKTELENLIPLKL